MSVSGDYNRWGPYQAAKHGCSANQGHGVARSEREDVGAGDRRPACRLHAGFDGVDDLVAAEGVGIPRRVLLADHCRRVVEEDGCIAALRRG